VCGRWGQLAVGPGGAIGEVFLFPDGDGALKRVDRKAASVESGGSMWRADGDEDAGLADFESAEAMRDGDAIDCELCVNVGGDFAQLRERHRFVGFVIKVERAAAVGIVADAAVEGDDGAVGIGADVADERSGIDRMAAELDEVVGGSGGHAGVRLTLTAADGREEGYFIAGLEQSRPSGKFAIAGDGDCASMFGQFGVACDALGEEVLDAGV
jgi:hypothetical protein